MRILRLGSKQTWWTQDQWMNPVIGFNLNSLNKNDIVISIDCDIDQRVGHHKIIWVVGISKYGLGIMGSFEDHITWEELPEW